MSFVSHLSVLQNVYPEQSNPPTSQCVFTSLNIRVHRWNRTDSRSNHWSGIQVARATAARISLKVGTADSMRGNNGEHVTKLSPANDKRKMKKYKLVNLTMWICSSAHYTSKPPQEKYISCQKPNILSLWVTDLRIPVSTFRDVYVNGADHVTESDLNCEIMTQNGSDDHGVVFARNPPRYSAI